jgi:hypothetical protein
MHCISISCGLPAHAGPGSIGLFGVDSIMNNNRPVGGEISMDSLQMKSFGDGG